MTANIRQLVEKQNAVFTVPYIFHEDDDGLIWLLYNCDDADGDFEMQMTTNYENAGIWVSNLWGTAVIKANIDDNIETLVSDMLALDDSE